VRVFGMAREPGLALAHHLGRALQLTNILRDLDEDAGLGRLYLPREELQAAGIASTEPAAVVNHPAIGQPCVVVAALAKSEFDSARAIMAQSPRRVVRAPRIMGEAYRLILERLLARGFNPPRPRVRLPRARLILIVLRNLF
jgi:phytoene synthase